MLKKTLYNSAFLSPDFLLVGTWNWDLTQILFGQKYPKAGISHGFLRRTFAAAQPYCCSCMRRFILWFIMETLKEWYGFCFIENIHFKVLTYIQIISWCTYWEDHNFLKITPFFYLVDLEKITGSITCPGLLRLYEIIWQKKSRRGSWFLILSIFKFFLAKHF